MQNNYFTRLSRTYLIAEVGVNHNGDLDLARKMVVEAKNAGADAVKFQTFTADALVTNDTPKVLYQKSTTSSDETHYEMIEKLELSKEGHYKLKSYCDQIGIDFLSTPYDIASAKFLLELDVKMFKTASADIVDLPLQRFIASTKKPAIIATGMSGLGDVEKVVDIYLDECNADVVLLHCVSNYPCSDESINMNAMRTLENAFSLPVGYSDHSRGYLAAVLSVSMGAKVIEKHFTLDRSLPGPDHQASSIPEEFSELVNNVRRAEKMLGSSRKCCQREERQMATVSRKSLVLAHSKSAGDTIELEDLCLMRPGDGISAYLMDLVIGRRLRTDLEARHKLGWEDLE